MIRGIHMNSEYHDWTEFIKVGEKIKISTYLWKNERNWSKEIYIKKHCRIFLSTPFSKKINLKCDQYIHFSFIKLFWPSSTWNDFYLTILLSLIFLYQTLPRPHAFSHHLSTLNEGTFLDVNGDSKVDSLHMEVYLGSTGNETGSFI